MREQDYSYAQKLAISAILVGIAVVVGYFRISVTILGANVMRVGFGGPFLKLAAILFGPIFGGTAAVVSDLLLFFIKPEGDYIFLLTVTAFLKGFCIGALWRIVKKISIGKYNVAYTSLFGFSVLLGAVNMCFMSFGPYTPYGIFLENIGKRSYFASIGLVVAGVLGLVIQFAARLIYEKDGTRYERYLKLVTVTGLPSLVFTTVNTYILMYYKQLGSKAFLYIWIPRFVEEILMVLLNIFILMIIMRAYETSFNRKVA